MYLSGLEGWPHISPDHLTLNPTTGFPLAPSQDGLPVDTWGIQNIPRGGYICEVQDT